MPPRRITLRNEYFYVHDPLEALSKDIVNRGDYFESDILDFLNNQYHLQNTIVDVGANIGNHTMFFARYFQYNHIYAFEPLYSNLQVLYANVQLLSYEQRPTVHTFPFALSDARKIGFIRINSGNMGAGEATFSIPLEDQENEFKYETTNFYPLDWWHLEAVSLLKIDVEWHEKEVLEGAKQTIEKWKPLILLEDTQEQYMGLMNDKYNYQLDTAFLHHKTYLYRSKDA